MRADLCTLHDTKSALASPQKHFINEPALCLALDTHKYESVNIETPNSDN